MKPWTEMTERERDVFICQTRGWRKIRHEFDSIGEYAQGIPPEDVEVHNIPHVSTDRAAAMSLLDEFPQWDLKKIGERKFYCLIYNRPMRDEEEWRFGKTEPEAICLAFLRAKGVEV